MPEYVIMWTLKAEGTTYITADSLADARSILRNMTDEKLRDDTVAEDLEVEDAWET